MGAEIPPRRRFNHESQCPVCLNNIQYEIETNCGHCFCGEYSNSCPKETRDTNAVLAARCWVAYRSHGNFLGAAHCPVCRQQATNLHHFSLTKHVINRSSQVTILFTSFTEAENTPSDDPEVTRQRETLLNEINSYNRRFSGEPRAVMPLSLLSIRCCIKLSWYFQLLDYLRDLPTLSRHLWNEFFSGTGLLYMFRLRIVMCLLAGVIYLISPLDIVPEAVFGILGLMDDIFVLLVICVYISMFYRGYIARRS